MNKYLLKTSKVVLCTLLVSTSSFYAVPEHEHLSDAANALQATHRHLRNNAIPWFDDLLKSDKKYKALVEEFKQHLASFDKEIVALLHKSSTIQQDDLTKMALDIIKDFKIMINETKDKLISLVGCKNSFTFMTTMKSMQAAMIEKLTNIEKKMKNFKRKCKEKQAHNLEESIVNLEVAISEFKKNNSNSAVSDLMKRIPAFVK